MKKIKFLFFIFALCYFNSFANKVYEPNNLSIIDNPIICNALKSAKRIVLLRPNIVKDEDDFIYGNFAYYLSSELGLNVDVKFVEGYTESRESTWTKVSTEHNFSYRDPFVSYYRRYSDGLYVEKNTIYITIHIGKSQLYYEGYKPISYYALFVFYDDNGIVRKINFDKVPVSAKKYLKKLKKEFCS